MYFIRIRVADAFKSVPTGAVPTVAVKAIDVSGFRLSEADC